MKKLLIGTLACLSFASMASNCDYRIANIDMPEKVITTLEKAGCNMTDGADLTLDYNVKEYIEVKDGKSKLVHSMNLVMIENATNEIYAATVKQVKVPKYKMFKKGLYSIRSNKAAKGAASELADIMSQM